MLLLATLVAACGGSDGPKEPEPPPPPPDLAGVPVMLLPARVGAPEGLDAELAFWLGERAPHTEWLLPEELQRVVDRSPAWRVDLATLPRHLMDMGSGDLRVPDPMYGTLRRLGAVVDAYHALVPLAVGPVTTDEGPALELTAALVDIRAARVVWVGTVRGDVSSEGPPSAASVAEALAQALVPL